MNFFVIEYVENLDNIARQANVREDPEIPGYHLEWERKCKGSNLNKSNVCLVFLLTIGEMQVITVLVPSWFNSKSSIFIFDFTAYLKLSFNERNTVDSILRRDIDYILGAG
jgi:hypothetical protein